MNSVQPAPYQRAHAAAVTLTLVLGLVGALVFLCLRPVQFVLALGIGLITAALAITIYAVGLFIRARAGQSLLSTARPPRRR